MSPNNARARLGQVRLLLLIAPRLGADKANLPLVDFIDYLDFATTARSKIHRALG